MDHLLISVLEENPETISRDLRLIKKAIYKSVFNVLFSSSVADSVKLLDSIFRQCFQFEGEVKKDDHPVIVTENLDVMAKLFNQYLKKMNIPPAKAFYEKCVDLI